LRQGEELAGMGAAGHQVVTGTFRRCLGEHGGLHVQEAVGVQELTQQPGDVGAELHVGQHLRAAQVEVAVAQAQLFRNIVVVQYEGRGLGGIEDFQLLAQHLDLAGWNLGIHGTLGATAHPPLHTQHVFAAHPLGGLEHFGQIGVVDHLDDAGPVPQVDEDDAAVVAAAVHPAAEFNGLVDFGYAGFGTIVSTH